jgi:ribosomal subunit interface protein
MLNRNIKVTGLELTPELHEYVDKKLAHAEKFVNGDTAAHADIELEHKPQGRSKKYRAECTLALSGGVYRISEWGETMHEALDVMVGELVRELTQDKKRRLHTLRKSASRVKEYLRGWRSRP